MGISRECLDRVLKSSNTFDIFVTETKIKPQSVIATVMFNKNQIKTVEFHVWDGFRLQGNFAELGDWCKEVYREYKLLKAQKAELQKDFVKRMEGKTQAYIEAIQSNYWTFDSHFTGKIEVPVTNEEIKQFAENQQEYCEEFLELLASFELAA